MKSAKDILVGLMCMSGMIFALSSYAKTSIQTISLYKNALPEAILKQYPILLYNFMDLIKVIPKPLPAPLEKFQNIFNNRLHVMSKYEFSIVYESGAFRTLDDVMIKKVIVKVRLKEKNQVEAFYIDLDQKQCVNSKLLKKEFGFFDS